MGKAIIRYFKGKYDDDITRIRCVMLLFHPFRNEVEEVHNNDKIFEKYNEWKETVEREHSVFEPNPEFMDFLETIEQENMEEDEEQQEQLDNDFVEEDTTRPEEEQDWLKKQGKQYDGTEIRLEDKKKLNKRINTLDVQQRKILDELMDIDDEKQYFLYLYGQAGTGKTYLLNTIIPALEFKSLKSGVDLDKPLILVMSPTASAAKHLVYGDTIHGALKINGFNNLEKQLLHGANATLSHDLSQVKHVIIHEISMVGANFFWDINQKLKQIMGSQEYFEGLNVIATGDFHQLPPVGDVWIFNRTSIRGRCNAIATNIWKVFFKMYKLTEHVRSEGDQDYSLLQEQIAIGKVSQDMYEKLNERVQAICDTEDNNDWYKDGKQIMITPTHDTRDRFNEKQLRNLNGEMILFAAKDNPSKRTPILPNFKNLNEKKTKGLVTNLQIKIGCPIKITININKKDSLVNGTFGYVCDVDEDQGIIWCIFSNKVGEVTRRNFGKRNFIHQNAIPIVRHTEQLKLTYEGKQYTFKRSQFPLVLGYAITCHASQGITKERVIIDYTETRPKHALFSVPFSRGRTLDGIFLKSFKKQYVYCDPKVLNEYDRLEKTARYQYSNTYLYDNWLTNPSTKEPSFKEIKMSYLNINGLVDCDHLECLRSDINLMSSDVICIAETKICQRQNIDISLNDFDIAYQMDNLEGKKSMGLIIYKRKSMEHFDISSTNDSDYQCAVCDLSCGIVCYIYLNPKIKRAKLADIMDMLTHYSQKENFLGVIGDLNIRSEFGIDTSTKLMDIFQKLGVKSAFKSVTHNLDGQLDYVLIRNDIQSNKYLAGTFKNLYSDHRSLFLRIPTDNNVIPFSPPIHDNT